MRIVFDIKHPAEFNFFKNTIQQLDHAGHKVLLIVLDRGPLPAIVRKEFHKLPVKIAGKHRGHLLSIIFEANVFRFFSILQICKAFKPDAGMSIAGFLLGFVLKLLRRPVLLFDDDPERKAGFFLERLMASALFLPAFFDKIKGTHTGFKALKEWAYLAPAYFKPRPEVLAPYNLEIKNYIFIREVSTGSLNYIHQKKALIATVSQQFPKNLKVVLSLEDKSATAAYPESWIILKEPLEDIHTLIYYSRLLIASGDSMAREGAILGVTSVYCGIRKMAANQILIDKKMLLHIPIHKLIPTVTDILNNTIAFPDQQSFRKKLNTEWEDLTAFKIKQLENHLKN